MKQKAVVEAAYLPWPPVNALLRRLVHRTLTRQTCLDTLSCDYKTDRISADVAGQAEQCMRNIASVLADASADMPGIVRIRYMLPDRAVSPRIWPVLQRWLGEVWPATALIDGGRVDGGGDKGSLRSRSPRGR